MSVISGKYLTAEINGVVISGTYAWTVEESADDLDATTGEDLGYANHQDGVWDATINLKGYMSITDGNYTQVRRGTVISNLQLMRNINDADPAFAFPEALVINSTQGGEVRGKVEWTARVLIRGLYTYSDPTG